jgi:BirA family biotin operon repressor/biotin-[acetyl-CoA-carboxylase] ligase
MRVETIHNPFGAPVCFYETAGSTMDVCRRLAAQGKPHGTAVSADYQEAGRGRGPGRLWIADRGKNLFCTILLRYGDISQLPQALTLRAGLAVALAVEDQAPSLAGAAALKWPNDIMLHGRKAAGILTEGDGKTVFLGIGVNVSQTVFPEHIRTGATSLLLALEGRPPPAREGLLERILHRLYEEFELSAVGSSWQERLAGRLYLRNQPVRFIPGPAGSSRVVEGTLAGIGPQGELRVIPRGETQALSFVTGELVLGNR